MYVISEMSTNLEEEKEAKFRFLPYLNGNSFSWLLKLRNLLFNLNKTYSFFKEFIFRFSQTRI